jgi:hypothetical protein
LRVLFLHPPQVSSSLSILDTSFTKYLPAKVLASLVGIYLSLTLGLPALEIQVCAI